jgi:hypothetical protein
LTFFIKKFNSIYLVDKAPFSPEEKKYIYELAEEYQRTNEGNIPWKEFQLKVKKKFGKLRSRNSIKNIWNSNKRRSERSVTVKGNEFNTIEGKIEDKDKIEDENKIDGKGEKDKSEIDSKDEMIDDKGVTEKVYKLAFPVDETEKYTFKFLLNNDDKNDDM